MFCGCTYQQAIYLMNYFLLTDGEEVVLTCFKCQPASVDLEKGRKDKNLVIPNLGTQLLKDTLIPLLASLMDRVASGGSVYRGS